MKELEDLRKDAISIFHAGLEAADPVKAVQRCVELKQNLLKVDTQIYDLSACDKVWVVGAGKASAKMAQAIEAIFGERLAGGVVNVKYGHASALKKVKVNEAGHPLPDEKGVQGTKEIIDLLKQTGERDFVLCLISGGGSALLPCPVEGLTLQGKQQTTKILLDCGARIHEINTIRKHLSQVKGGRLAQLAYPSTLVSLILSDVVGDDLDTIGSGPTVADRSTFQDCLAVLEKYEIRRRVHGAVANLLERGANGEVKETPKQGDPVLSRVQNVIVGSNTLAVRAAQRKADALGYHSLVLSTCIEGETRDVAKVHAAIAKEILRTGNPIPIPACVISGGETTVTIRGKGLGGRNQEFTLAAAIALDGLRGVVALSGGTDGTDGPTDAAGAIGDGSTLARARQKGLDAEAYLRENDSYHFFEPLGELLITGPTVTNVMDLRLILAG